ncbi:LysR family transcriptional regulator [Mesorhizobium sp. M4B.F.Ca.ET.215.01.1.1]|uniref:LysR family transcriptional regulator n=1 Tax=Mesorhizobium TaxID=68287 RepID=UPI000FCCB957|nr:MULTISPECIES: LysR family transcriptional regulator [Mesorhizobium]MDX8435039.1 LysR family transcriptional regulator [Mesorhizobium abyssinicae]RUW24424.1 LysR family transcriptional regulator [Mesorhizobium sp. M4B.F.Ca.ET.013.02.1.1]RVD42252.1 LysR family transcriptional regulator [Mesorhizobium sp. M4B.F.Ca.ET.019.03.1.1]TGQ11108.1 LysR family transcriptional regulator [Mesorhizobium sp. M4B.F.Ca.ET.215.01.1.1]TGQ38939.1 LysR family transcriptional regulator [Mesorhizobium sp. M4B.F.Ca.
MAGRIAGALPPLDWLRSFEAAARLSNFTAAAAELGLTQAAVSQHIRSLEQRLKTRLFVRLARGVALSPEGAAYLPHIQSAFATIGNSTTELFEPRAVQTVTVRVPISFALLVLVPALPDLARALPRIQLDVVTIHRPADYDQPGSTLDIRFGNGNFPGREADRLTVERLVPVASPALAGNADWTSLPLLLVAGAREMWAEWFSAAGVPGHTGRSHRFDSFVAAMEAAKAGAGALLGSRPLIDTALAGKALVALSGFELSSSSGHFLTRASAAGLTQAEQDFRLWLLSRLAGIGAL